MERFDFAFDDRFRPLLRTFSVGPDTAEVRLTDDDRFVASFGRLRISTPLSNVAGTRITGPYRWYRAIGARSSLADRGATFGSSTGRGLCVCFHEPVRGLFGSVVRHPGLTVTVRDCEGLQRALEARIAAGAAGTG